MSYQPPGDSESRAAWPDPPPPPSAVPRRRRNPALVVAAAVAGVLFAGAAVGVPLGLLTRGSHAGPAASATSPIPRPSPTSATLAQARALYQQALAATRGSAGFHYVALSTGGTDNQKIVGDAGQSGGSQVITLNSTYVSEQFTLLLVGGTVFFQGNAAAVEDQLGVPAARAPAVQGTWVSISSGNGPYSVVAPGITVADQATQLPLAPTSTNPLPTATGASASRILGTVPRQQGAPGGTAHLDIDTGSHLPISYVSTMTLGGVTRTSTITFSAWGTAAAPPAPPGAVAWSTLGASRPPGGYGGGGGGQSPSATPQV